MKGIFRGGAACLLALFCLLFSVDALATVDPPKVSYTYMIPGTTQEREVTLNDNTVFAAVWGNDGTIQIQKTIDDYETYLNEINWTLPWGSGNSLVNSPVYYFVKGTLTLDQKLHMQENGGQYIIGLGNDATLKRGASNGSDLIQVKGNKGKKSGLYNITLDGNSDNMTLDNTAKQGGLLAVTDGTVELVSVTMTNNYVGDNPDGVDGERGYGVLRIMKEGTDGGSNVTMTDCTISGNKSHGKGAGVYLDGGSTLQMTGTNSITGNTCLYSDDDLNFKGAGIYVESGATLKMKDSVTVRGNEVPAGENSTKNSDIYLDNGSVIEVTGTLTTNATTPIGIDNRGVNVVFATGTDMSGTDRYDKLFFSNQDSTVHAHRTTGGMIFCKDHYTVTYMSDGEKKAEHTGLVYGTATPAAPAVTKEGYRLTGWSPAIADTVTGNATYTAQWAPNVYTVKYVDSIDNAELQKNENLSAGTAIPAFVGTLPVHEGYTFTGWENQTNNLQPGDALSGETYEIVFEAQWEQNKYTVVYQGEGIEKVTYNNVSHGTATPGYNEAGTDPVREDYVFAGWTPEVADTVTDDATYTAQWVHVYTVTYTDGVDGVELFADEVYPAAGGDALMAGMTIPQFTGTPEREGYRFMGWTSNCGLKPTDEISGEVYAIVFTADWAKLYTVTYTDGAEGETVFEDMRFDGLISGDVTPVFALEDGSTVPVRAGYTFAGWEPKVSATVVGDTLYTALWNPIAAPETPNTGDPSWLMGWISLLGASAAGLKLRRKQ